MSNSWVRTPSTTPSTFSPWSLTDEAGTAPIRTEADYRAALARVEKFFDAVDEPVPDSPEGSYFDALVTLIQAYEARHYPVAPPTPVEAIKFRMEQGGLGIDDMVPYIGPRHRVYEVLNGTRPAAV